MARKFEIDIEKDYHALVVKNNDLIQKSRFSLSTQEQKIILYLISKIEKDDEDFKLYRFKIKEFCDICGIDKIGGKEYKSLKDSLKKIADKSLWITLPNGVDTLLRWIEKPYIDYTNGVIEIRLDRDMKPYLLQLKENFTSYEIFYTLVLRSKYSIRLYELVKSIHYNELTPYETIFSIDELKRLLGAENYNTFQHFKDRVFERAITEINIYSDKIIDFQYIKSGKRVSGVKIKVISKTPTDRMKTDLKIEYELGLNQMRLKEFIKRG